MRSRKFARVLAGLSCVSLFGGLYFPIAVLMDEGPSVMVYGLVLVSFHVTALPSSSAGSGTRRE